MRARSEHRVKKEQQHRLAKEFVANMQERVSAMIVVVVGLGLVVHILTPLFWIFFLHHSFLLFLSSTSSFLNSVYFNSPFFNSLDLFRRPI
jgi:hypothetical protein